MINPRRVFERDLPGQLSDFQIREVQIQLAERVAQIISDKTVGVFEAGTGAGKTLAYLVPAFLSGERIVVSTATRNLQDQLFFKDLPMLQALFPDKRVALLKGRSNYLCPYRMKASIRATAGSEFLMQRLQEVRTWSSMTSTGDLTEYLDTDSEGELVNLVSSNRDNCLGSRCPNYSECPLYLARQRAQDADVLIVNHHLLLANLARDDDHFQTLLPQAGCVVIDEAHAVPEIARQFYGQRLGSGQVAGLIKDLRTELHLVGGDDPESSRLVDGLERSFQAMRRAVLASEEKDYDRWLSSAGTGLIHQLDEDLADLESRLQLVDGRSEGLKHCTGRVVGLIDQFAMLTESAVEQDNHVHWIDRTAQGFTIHLSPLSVAEDFRNLLESSESSWVFTSATLSVDGSFDLIQRELGLGEAVAEVFDSPFNYGEITRGYVPAGLPTPGDDAHTVELVRHCLPLIEANMGRTFFLFTSYRAMQQAAELLSGGRHPLFVQGSMSKRELLGRFSMEAGSILLGTQSFWEGVDVRGTGLRLLIIDKLPFPNPSDPVFRAQEKAMTGEGRSSFRDLSLPRAALSLKQGFGRLIREASDAGLFVLGDSRVREKAYGKYFMINLPVTRWEDERHTALEWLVSL